ncbi:MAG: PAS domain S-box protein [Firmicutes bacterium]|nr:PAS domain S-box protein [Bacillota bacterium]
MNIIQFSKEECNHCYRCLRACSSKAIKIIDKHAEVVNDRCIACGECEVVCPKGAVKVLNNVKEIKEVIKSDKKVIASIAPSFSGAFEMKDPMQIVTALKKLGFDNIEETAIGAEIVSNLYRDYVDNGDIKNLITTSCPSANYLIEKYYPSLIKYMLPIVSPMMAHGKLLKHNYGMDCHVVFIGPCIAKKFEAEDFQNEGIINSVLNFEELQGWIKDEGIDLKKLKPTKFDKESFKIGNKFPIKRGVATSFLDSNNHDNYEVIQVDGIEECKEILECLKKDNLEGVCVELNVCKGSCIDGPCMPKESGNFHLREKKIKEYVKTKKECINDIDYDYSNIDFHIKFLDKSIKKDIASEKEIEEILKKMGKYESKDELNCYACGYKTCREKAQAVYEGMAELEMCLPYMRSKAESLRNLIFEQSPNAIFLLDCDNFIIKEVNPACERLFNINADDLVGKPVSILLKDECIKKVKETGKDLIGKKSSFPKYGLVLYRNVLYIEKQNVIMVILTDVTDEEKNKEELAKVKENTINAAQDVIDKQMRVAQEIASLLGETTAETKATLTKLKNIAIGEKGDKR